MSFFGMLSKLFNSEEYRKNPVPQNLTPEQFAAISIGAINAEQTEYFCDSLPTGSDVGEIKDNLSSFGAGNPGMALHQRPQGLLRCDQRHRVRT